MSPMESVYNFIKEKILDGTYKPGQKLFERELSEITGASRNTIKKSLLMLESENLVLLEKNKGATIKSFTIDDVINYLEIRNVLEGLIVQTAVTNISDSELQRLKDTVEMMGSYLKNKQFDSYSKLNKEFHNIIYNASTNAPAVEIINTIKTQLGRFHFKTILIPGRTVDSYKEHEAILKAFIARDPKKAKEAIQKHIDSVLHVIVENYNLLT